MKKTETQEKVSSTRERMQKEGGGKIMENIRMSGTEQNYYKIKPKRISVI